MQSSIEKLRGANRLQSVDDWGIGGTTNHRRRVAYYEPNDEILTNRDSWTGKFDFLLSLIGYSVGLGNVWRFPYLCYNNGGGAFLIPFTVMLVIAGLPLMFMELSLAQYAGLGPAVLFGRFSPLLQGLGLGMVLIAGIVMLYYNVILAWTLLYMLTSFEEPLPWKGCHHAWTTKFCYSYEEENICLSDNGTYYLRECYANSSMISNFTKVAKRPPAEEFFKNYILQLSSGIEHTGQINITLALSLLAAWLIVFLCLCRGVKSSGKVVYFTALFPYVVLVMLFIRGITLPGAHTGIKYYLEPDWEKLKSAQIWGDAAVQIFFALSPAWGGLLTLASYNKFTNNCYRDAIIVATTNILTSFFAGFVIFSILGFLAHELDTEVGSVIDQGAGLAFVVFPEMVTKLQMPMFWSVLFFFMLLTLGLDSQFALMETVVTGILDTFPKWRRWKTRVVFGVATVGYVGGLVFVTNSGMYWFQLVDKYAANWSVLLIATIECILIAWIYGSKRFISNIEEMIGPRSNAFILFWTVIWKFVTPVALLFILCFNWIQYKPVSYGKYAYPDWADIVGWAIGLLPMVAVVLTSVYKILSDSSGQSIAEKVVNLLKPTDEWKAARGHQFQYDDHGIEI
ncbi:sodium- and chloride-dependent glycine transporter 2-like isoform X2 [Malaya genurostris]|uniref:sodium- and chloride-dependent glycine transporter 2-like isoform X2 n=1 Tax=Malaya genurostris TaxID=325434 RepID=UPI0026F39CC8|nr:sodium- and chloride-dependent glycine transporter 2-like isoform X2 [Malaya genurostris]